MEIAYQSLLQESMSDKLTLKECTIASKSIQEMHESEKLHIREEAAYERGQFIKQIEEIHAFYQKKIESVKTSYELSFSQIEELQSEIIKIEVLTKIQKERDEDFSKANAEIHNRLKEADVITR